MAGLGALRKFDFDHLDLIGCRIVLKFLSVEPALRVATAEIARAEFPHQIAAVLAVITRH